MAYITVRVCSLPVWLAYEKQIIVFQILVETASLPNHCLFSFAAQDSPRFGE